MFPRMASEVHYQAEEASHLADASTRPQPMQRTTRRPAHALRPSRRRRLRRSRPDFRTILSITCLILLCALAVILAFPQLLPGGTTTHRTAAPTGLLPTGRPVVSNPPPSAGASAAPASGPVSTTVSAVAPPVAPVTSTTAAPPPTPAEQVLALINKARSAAGLPAYVLDSGLVASATAHNQTMAGGCGLSHQCPREAAIGDRENAAGVHWTAAGENIGEGGPVANSNAGIANMAVGLTQGMLNEQPPDDGHRQNILSSTFTRVGIAVFRDSAGTVWLTQDFAN